MATGEPVDETAIKSMGDLALDRISAWHYDYNHKSKMNEDFVKAFKPSSSATRTSSRSAAMTECTSSTRR